MHKLRTGIRFAPLLAIALFWVCVTRLGLWVMPHRKLRRMLVSERSRNLRWQPMRIVWAVRHASRLVPMATCLTQALAAQAMLARSGVPSTLTLGVDPERKARFEAHAWLEIEGRAVLGGTDESLANHARLARFSAGAA